MWWKLPFHRKRSWGSMLAERMTRCWNGKRWSMTSAHRWLERLKKPVWDTEGSIRWKAHQDQAATKVLFQETGGQRTSPRLRPCFDDPGRAPVLTPWGSARQQRPEPRRHFHREPQRSTSLKGAKALCEGTPGQHLPRHQAIGQSQPWGSGPWTSYHSLKRSVRWCRVPCSGW